MSTDKRFNESVSSWLEANAPSRMPEQVLNAAFERTRNSKQHVGARALLGRLEMLRFTTALGSAVAIVAIAALALSFNANRSTGIGAAPPSPSTTSSPSVASTNGPDCVELNGGDYRVAGIPATANMPTGWHGWSTAFHIAKAPCPYNAPVKVDVSLVSHVFADACNWRGTGVEVSTPAAVTEALAVLTGLQSSEPTEVTLAGHPASRFEFSFPADADPTTCNDGRAQLWHAPGRREGLGQTVAFGQTATVYVVDVDGLALAVAATRWDRDATADDVAALDAVVASLRFEP